MNTQGHFRIIREIFNKEIFKNVVDFRLFFLILGQAMFRDGVPAGGIILERGEWLRSYRQLQKDLEYIDGRAVRQYGIATLKRSTERLTAEHLISTKKADSGTVFRVEKYNELQGIAEFPTATAERNAEHHSGTKRIKEVLRSKENKEIINIQQQQQQPLRAARQNFFDKYFVSIGRMPNGLQREKLTSYIDHEGIEEEAVCLAIELTARAGANFFYLEAILKSWLQKGIKTTEQALKAEQDRKGQRERITQNDPFKQATTATKPKLKEHYPDIEFDW